MSTCNEQKIQKVDKENAKARHNQPVQSTDKSDGQYNHLIDKENSND